MSQNRDYYIDFMRSIGLILLVGVHVNAPDWYVVTRCFDVPLMVCVSMLCVNSIPHNYLNYCIKRFKRIYIPVFIFLILYFLGDFLICHIYSLPSPSKTQIIGSFLMLNYPSIKYVWIMRVFLLMALIVPILKKIIGRISFGMLCIVAFSIIAVQPWLEDLINQISFMPLRGIGNQFLLYLTGYIPIAMIGLRLRDMSSIERYIIVILSLICILSVSICNGSFDPQSYKYPPQPLYILYGIFVSTVIYIMRPLLCKSVNWKGFAYISKNSMWIYLWHIIPVTIMENFHISEYWIVRYIAAFTCALFLDWFWKIITYPLPDKIRNYIG